PVHEEWGDKRAKQDQAALYAARLPAKLADTMVRDLFRRAGVRLQFRRIISAMLRGSLTALVTPFDTNGRFDAKAFAAFVDWQITEGTTGLVPVGTTGESPTLSHAEHRDVVKACIAAARGRVPVVAGAGSNNTEEAIGLAKFAEEAGADAVLVVTPYYN